MANRKISNSFRQVTVTSATTEAVQFPKENAINIDSPQRAWRTTDTAESRLVIDLGATATDLTCYVDWVNFTQMKYQESADGSTGWADVTSVLTVEPDPMHGVYRRRDEITLTGKQYLGLLIPVQSTVDGAGYFRVGTVALPESVVELDAETTVEYPFDVAIPETGVVINQFPTGKSEKIRLGNMQPMIISFTLRSTVYQNLKGPRVQEIGDLLRDSTKTMYLDMNLGQSWQAYIVKKTGELRASLNTPAVSTAEFGTVLFEVVV